MQKITPLKVGDTILLISPAKAIDQMYLDLAIDLFTHWGLKVEVGKHAAAKAHYFAGTDEQRTEDLQWALDHPTAKAIVCSRGGYGSVRIVDQVNYSTFLQYPKWFVGFSDVTVFHNKMHQAFELPSIHALAPLYLDRLDSLSEAVTSLKKALFGEQIMVEVDGYDCNREGQSTGVLVGGNLALIASLLGTDLDISTDGKILFLEEVSEYAYRFDRMLWSLKKAGKLNNLRGLVIGGLTDMKQSEETFGCSVEELVRDLVNEYDYPVMFKYPAGHQMDNRALVFGKKYELEVTPVQNTLKQLMDG